MHRDLSWLQFNRRVLAEARETANPLMERLKFLSITSSNLDEFFSIRVASLVRSMNRLVSLSNQDDKALYLRHVQFSILEKVAQFVISQNRTLENLARELRQLDIFVVSSSKKKKGLEFELGKKIFEEKVLPELQAPEPFFVRQLNELLNLQFAGVFQGEKKTQRFWIRIPKKIPAAFLMEHQEKFYVYFLDDLLLDHLNEAFRIPDEVAIVRVTRDGDIDVDLEEEDTESIPDVVRSSLRSRDKGRFVRLQYRSHGTVDIGRFATVMHLSNAQIFGTQAVAPQGAKQLSGQPPGPLRPLSVSAAFSTMCLHGLWGATQHFPAASLKGVALNYPDLKGLIPKDFTRTKKQSIFESLKQHDFLLHHPYDHFDSYVEWIKEAAEDKNVTQIEQTVYRMDALSPVIKILKDAAKKKKIRVIVELRARFDELNNLRLTEELRHAGVDVGFGFGQLKLHAKVALVTRQENGADKLYTHLSTGNYNANTARQYTDLAILTANTEFGQDARKFFDSVFAGLTPTQFKQLIAAPSRLHRKIFAMIGAETRAAAAGKPARIVAKVNALVDESVIERLYRASQAGVKVDLIVRGACSLVPGVKGLSENIRVVSIVDRFLEHSRIYYFEHSERLYLSSADWMQRNFFSRLELAFPVLDPRIYDYIVGVLLPAYLLDNQKSWELNAHGVWKRKVAGTNDPVRAQFYFEKLATQAYQNTPIGRKKEQIAK